ncbi:hypothetical protein Pmani_018402 [Petrolisthes manimaculis]|uniref:Uncharacterized protein n=1 Tax=Petrolisthes manimaculis TaxID=1843537 RepID=A0AAE1PMT1_9EUCA|nr:hypothetical protein Pmani_018402 [Petrolisthes manimaculis]
MILSLSTSQRDWQPRLLDPQRILLSSLREKPSGSTRKRRRLRRSLYDDHDYASQDSVRNLTEENAEIPRKMVSHRHTIVDLQTRNAEVRLEQAEEETRHNRKLNALNEDLQEKIKEAKINRQIAEAKAAKMGIPIWR